MKFIDTHHDQWHTAGGEDGPIQHPAPRDGLLLTLDQWRAVRESWPAGIRTGVILANTDGVEGLEADLPRLALIVLQFPKWVDGRAYSQARLLRARYRFGGEIRATGDVLVDMVSLLQRCGVDAVVMRADQRLDAAQRALGFFGGYYQADVHERRPLFQRPAEQAWQRNDEYVDQGAAI